MDNHQSFKPLANILTPLSLAHEYAAAAYHADYGQRRDDLVEFTVRNLRKAAECLGYELVKTESIDMGR